MKIEEIKVGDKDVEITAEVKSIAEPKEVTTRFGSQIILTVATLKDKSGEIDINLWGDAPEGLAVGKTLEIKGAFVKAFRDKKSLNMMKKGSVKVL